ncbi:histidine racemase CntK [Mammaliicoccus sciuri]|uniref:Histidine racemase CntK n=1 Tax=Mammaliicoccus sciuri TaxID=1296 RepID=A0AAJ4SJ53_MAMSC|nr:histidine racemase CntK [Mammaliicoccus sciuri]RTX74083.1 histidine racemase CntK [Mammaliicoccus sciuri]
MSQQVVEFSKYNPAGNMTILVHSKHNCNDYSKIAKQLMMYNHVCCEQVGFIESDMDKSGDYHLVMSGNEFCGNATMSYIRYLEDHDLLETNDFQIKVSGCNDLVKCAVHKKKDNSRYYEVGMPKAERVSRVHLSMFANDIETYEIVYDSYIHYMILVDEITCDLQKQIEDFIHKQEWLPKYKTIGMMLFDESRQFLKPLIYIREVQSLIWENSCGSGTASIGIFYNTVREQKCKDFIVYQPGGKILVTTKKCDELNYEISIKGKVFTVATGEAYVDIGESI